MAAVRVVIGRAIERLRMREAIIAMVIRAMPPMIRAVIAVTMAVC